ncbi:MAG: thiamine pyrophosphate-binding protein [Acidobacteriia bacterium]|nr:thiamine pyrophosphate-binding protein [Terriglobia bacterium]
MGLDKVMQNGAELFVRTLTQLGIRHIFTLVGDHLNEVLAVAAREGVRIIDMRHESGVTHAADAWARLTRRPAVSLVTGGPGHTNSLTGIATANLAGSPLIAVSGSRASTLGDRGGFQDIDQVSIARPVVKWAAQPPNAAQIPFYLTRAYAEANNGRRGAVHLTIPVDLFTAKTDDVPAVHLPPERPAPGPGAAEVDRAVAMLRAAERPVVIAGSGIWWSGAEADLQNFIEKSSLPLYTITMARGVVPDSHPLCMGYADPALNRAALEAYREADVLLVIGKRLDYRLALGGPRVFPASARFIQVDIHAQELGMNRKLDVAVCADAGSALRALTEAWPDRGDRSEWVEHLRALREQREQDLEHVARDGSRPLHPAAFFRELRHALPPEILYAWDGGDFAHWGRVSLPALKPGGWLRLGPLGTIGSSLPNGIALQLAHPDKPVAVITGDGALGFYLAEMDTAVRHKLPIVVIVGNDAGWGLERELQKETTSARTPVATELSAARYDAVMEAFGGAGETIDRLDQVRPAVKRAFTSGKPYCLNVSIRGARSPFTDWQISGKKK